MKVAFIGLALLLCLSVSPVSADDKNSVTYGSGDGYWFKTAVTIAGAKNETEGVQAEYAYLNQHFPNYKLTHQTLLNNENRKYDLIEFIDNDGTNHVLYFDITDFYGKF